MPKSIIQNRLAELVARKGRKERRRITQRDIAKETGIALSTISMWMRDDNSRVDGKTIAALMYWLDISDVGELLVLEIVEDHEEEIQKALLTAI